MSTTTLSRFLLAAVALTVARPAVAADYYWASKDALGDNNGWNNTFNWSIDGSVDTEPTEVPDADDVIYWAFDDAVDNSISLNGNREAQAIVVDTNTNDGPGTFPFINDGAGQDPLRGVTLFGATLDHVEIDDFGFATTVREDVEDTVIMSASLGFTFGPNLNLTLGGGGTKAISNGNAQFKIQRSLLESDPDTGLRKFGTGNMIVEDQFGLTGEVVIEQGKLSLLNGFATPGTLSFPTGFGFQEFVLYDGQDYQFTAVTLGVGAEEEFSLEEGTYTQADLDALGYGDNFTISGSGTGTLTVAAFVEPILEGDYNDDGVVDAADFTVWRDNLNLPVTLPGDTTPGLVTIDDYQVWATNFGATDTSSVVAATPEPSTLAAAIVLAGSFIGWRRRPVR